VQIVSKEDLRKALRRSPDRLAATTIALAHSSEGIRGPKSLLKPEGRHGRRGLDVVMESPDLLLGSYSQTRLDPPPQKNPDKPGARGPTDCAPTS
jgi:hypothetical protein